MSSDSSSDPPYILRGQKKKKKKALEVHQRQRHNMGNRQQKSVVLTARRQMTWRISSCNIPPAPPLSGLCEKKKAMSDLQQRVRDAIIQH